MRIVETAPDVNFKNTSNICSALISNNNNNNSRNHPIQHEQYEWKHSVSEIPEICWKSAKIFGSCNVNTTQRSYNEYT